jgi:galactose oxidase-like protein/Calx-beta domain-containing protein/Kelch motif protein
MFHDSFSRPAHSYSTYNRLFPYIRWILIFAVFVTTLLPTKISAQTSAGTIDQDFDNPGTGSSYEKHQFATLPEPTEMPGGPTPDGNLLRLVTVDPSNMNTVVFSDVMPATNVVVADFDFRITPGNAVISPNRGRADGFSFTLLNTTNDPGLAATEEPNFPGSLGIGFDIYRNTDLGDIGNDNILGNFSDSISVHFDGTTIKQYDATNIVDLAGGRWIHARIILRPGGGFSDVRIILTPQDCNPVDITKRPLFIRGFVPYEGRVLFGARSGPASPEGNANTANFDLDNIKAQFLKSTQSVFSLSSVNYQVEESTPSVTVTVMRTGNTRTTARVNYLTTDGDAISGSDYTPTSGILTFAAGQTRKQFTIPILPTAGQETDEYFQVLLEENQNSPGAVVGGPARAVVKIFDLESMQLVGRWTPPMCWPIVAVHMHLLPTRKVLFWDRLGNISFWNPANQQITAPVHQMHNLFCSGHTFLANGNLFVAGGHDHTEGGSIGDGVGLKHATMYNPFTNTWSVKPAEMNAGRWYPTTTTLANGQVLVISGSITKTPPPENLYIKNLLPQVWETSTNTWRDLTGAEAQPINGQAHGDDLYPRMFLVPDGRVFKAGPDQATWFLDTAGTGQWAPGFSSIFGLRTYGIAVMYEPGKILIAGGGDPPTDTAEVLDLTGTDQSWHPIASMQYARRQLNATLLPDGTVLVTGGTGGSGFNDEAQPVLPAELWDPQTRTWTTLPAMQVTRGYHSTALLLPDGRVLVAGGGQGAGAVQNHNDAEIYLPAYLFKGPRPQILQAPTTIRYGNTFLISTPNAADIGGVSMIRLASVTHSFDQNQRFLWLSFSATAKNLSVTAPATGNVAPPGHYMLFILNSNRVPSAGRIIQIR